MRRTREQLTGELMAAAEKAIGELMAWEEGAIAPNLTEIEEKVLEVRQRLSEEMAEIVIEAQSAREPYEAPACARCGEAMEAKGSKGKRVVSRVGTLAIERNHYYCPRCESGVFPPGRAT
jgi:ribosomal protein S27AE